MKDLFWGNISPTECSVRPGSDYKKASAQICEQIDRLLEILTPEEKEQLEVIDSLRNNMAMMAEEDMFIYGFRLGARMMLDVVGEYSGQFTDVGEKAFNR